MPNAPPPRSKLPLVLGLAALAGGGFLAGRMTAPAPAPRAHQEAAGPAAGKPAEDDRIVFVTKSGTKYHRAGCSSLRSSSIEMPLSEARVRYGPCSKCSPPV